jgi:hypothetical protein
MLHYFTTATDDYDAAGGGSVGADIFLLREFEGCRIQYCFAFSEIIILNFFILCIK